MNFHPIIGRLTCLTAIAALIGGLIGVSGVKSPAIAFELAVLDLSLEELMQIKITSVAKKEQTLGDTAAAVFVITAEDIRRSGALSVPEVLRLAPGVQAFAVNNNLWLISMRGYEPRFDNKLMVLVDGRSVYSPLFSGVHWDSLDVPLELIERIEVIRGPAGSVWGANAVNGVINIITRRADDPEGQRLTLASGSQLRGRGVISHNWQAAEHTFLRVHALGHDVSPSRTRPGHRAEDFWRLYSAGLRLDHSAGQDRVTLHSRLGAARTGEDVTLNDDTATMHHRVYTGRIDSGFVQAAWQREASAVHSHSLQAIYEYGQLYSHYLEDQRSTVDLEYQLRWQGWEHQDITWGLGYRVSWDNLTDATYYFYDASKTLSLYSVSLQNDITLVPRRWRLVLGARLDHHDYSGWELQPNARLLWNPMERHTLWMSLSRAVRTPMRLDQQAFAYYYFEDDIPVFTRVDSNMTRSEKLYALDAGWRQQWRDNLTLDLAGFYYHYTDLGGERQTLIDWDPAGYIYLEADWTNTVKANAAGIEAALNWRPFSVLRLQTSWSWTTYDMDYSRADFQPEAHHVTHQSLWSLRAFWDITPTLHLDAWGRAARDTHILPNGGFTTMDLRLAWRARPNLELSLAGQNLLQKSHQEFSWWRYADTEVQRSFYLKLDWRY